ncbi:MAG: hypothetical protein ACI4BD_01370 [Paludibacteraceae bacterium]
MPRNNLVVSGKSSIFASGTGSADYRAWRRSGRQITEDAGGTPAARCKQRGIIRHMPNMYAPNDMPATGWDTRRGRGDSKCHGTVFVR